MLEVSGTGVEAKSEPATKQFVSLIFSAQLPCRPLLLRLYVFDSELRSSLEKPTPLELSASGVGEPTRSRRRLVTCASITA